MQNVSNSRQADTSHDETSRAFDPAWGGLPHRDGEERGTREFIVLENFQRRGARGCGVGDRPYVQQVVDFESEDQDGNEVCFLGKLA